MTSTATNEYVGAESARENITEDFWIGGRDTSKKGNWTWTDGSAWEFTDWARFRPDDANQNGNQDCVQFDISFGNWRDVKCDLTLVYVCSTIMICPGIKTCL